MYWNQNLKSSRFVQFVSISKRVYFCQLLTSEVECQILVRNSAIMAIFGTHVKLLRCVFSINYGLIYGLKSPIINEFHWVPIWPDFNQNLSSSFVLSICWMKSPHWLMYFLIFLLLSDLHTYQTLVVLYSFYIYIITLLRWEEREAVA